MEPALVSLTFDDGLRCQFEQGVPVLDRYGFPATFFLVANTDPIFTDGWAEKTVSRGAKFMERRRHPTSERYGRARPRNRQPYNQS